MKKDYFELKFKAFDDGKIYSDFFKAPTFDKAYEKVSKINNGIEVVGLEKHELPPEFEFLLDD